MFTDHLVQGVQVVCWNDGCVSEFAASYLSMDSALLDCAQMLAGSAGVCGVGFQSRAGSFVSAGVCFCPRFSSQVRAWCC